MSIVCVIDNVHSDRKVRRDASWNKCASDIWDSSVLSVYEFH